MVFLQVSRNFQNLVTLDVANYQLVSYQKKKVFMNFTELVILLFSYMKKYSHSDFKRRTR